MVVLDLLTRRTVVRQLCLQCSLGYLVAVWATIKIVGATTLGQRIVIKKESVKSPSQYNNLTLVSSC